MIFLAILLVGTIALLKLPIELLPNFSFGDISIYIDVRGGMPPVEVESLVTKPVEEAVGTVSHLNNIISISEESRSRVILRFEPGIDMNFVALEVREKFARIKDKLPKEIERPVIAQFQQTDYPIIILAVTAKNYTTEMLRRIVDDDIKEVFQRVEGVANVEVGGGRERKILVEVYESKLRAYNLSLGKLINKLNLNNLNLLIGEVDRVKDKYLIRAIGEFTELDEIRMLGVAVSPSGSVVRLKDVADVKDSYLEATSYARVNTLPVISIYIQKESMANTIKVTDAVDKEIKGLEERLDKRVKLIKTYNQADSIKKAIDSVKTSLLYGALLAVIILYIFLRNFKDTFIIATSIPISVMITFGFMFFSKVTLNVMTLSGLALGIGMLVDNSVVVLENIFSMKERGMNAVRAAVEGSSEMLLAIVASTITTVVVFLPIVFVNKEIRILYSGLALTVTFSLIASLFVAISLVPMLSASLSKRFSKKAVNKPRGPGRLKDFMLKFKAFGYRRLLGFILRARFVFLIIVFVLFAAAVWKFMGIEKEFIGTLEQEDFTIFVELPSGAKLEISDKAVKQIESILAEVPEVKTASARVEPWSSKIYVKLVPLEERKLLTKEVIDKLRPKIKKAEEQFKEAFIYFEEPQAVETNEVVLEIFGYNYEILNQLAVSMVNRMQQIGGLTDVKIRWRKGRPEWQLKVNKESAASFGLTVSEISEQIHAKMRGLRATLYHTEGKEIEVVARLEESDRRVLEQLKKITILLDSGETIYLEQVIDFVPGVGPSKVWRKNKHRMIQVSANRGKHAFGTASSLIKESIKDMKFPKDYSWRFGENYWRMMENQKQMTFALILTLILVYLVLASLFESYTQPFIIMMTVPIALIGVTIALRSTHKPINIGVLMGAIMLGGIVVNNAIIMIDYINRLMESKYNRF
ncbi:MAG: hypothetical protein AUJ75_02620, partial [Candidatus Omnitrophica bacterium CG1_02_49_10]